MRYVEYVHKFEERILNILTEYIRNHTEIDDDDGILIDYRTHTIEETNRKDIKGRRGDFYSMRYLVNDFGVGYCICLDIIDDIVSMYV